MRVSVLAYPGCLAAEVFGVADVLLIANRVASATRPGAAAPFEVAVVGARRGGVEVAGGVRLAVRRPSRSTDLLIVPAFDVAGVGDLDAVLRRLGPEIALIARQGARGPVAAVCGGAFLLGEAGLLDGRRATTAWPFTAELARRYPSARVDPEALLLQDGPVATTGAFTASHDLAIALVRDRADEELVRLVAKVTLLDGARSSQAPYVDARLMPGDQDPFSAKVTRWLIRHLREPYSLDRTARAFHVSTRTLLRRFKGGTGRSPLEQLQELRVSRAKKLLEATDLGVAEVAERVGYSDLSTFVRLFARKATLTPAAYRRRFRG